MTASEMGKKSAAARRKKHGGKKGFVFLIYQFY
jgi:hypothetical protein